MLRLVTRALSSLAVILLLTSAPSPANASPETLARSVSNILFSPFDLVLSPYVATRTVYQNWKDSDDSTAVRIAYPLPGVIWVTGVQAGASVIRGVTGLLEFIPAIPLAFVDADIDPLFDPVERNQAVVDTSLFGERFPVKFGIDYTSLPAY
ncbi:MAG: hypothetical protein JSU66_12620 [Deltaproteobacteria bacterium]|nr:MAG: hypothetical protein JSU66_12620 [Deltaproteobacteria bacterium]